MYRKPHLPKASILLLEEDPFLRAGLASLMGEAGYHVAEGLGGTRQIDLALAGIVAGQAPCAALGLLDHRAPVILLPDHASWTGLDFLDIADTCGAAAVLPRPFSRAALLALVAKTLSQPEGDAAEISEVELPSPTELLICFHNPNFV
jgi:hypothetical protein